MVNLLLWMEPICISLGRKHHIFPHRTISCTICFLLPLHFYRGQHFLIGFPEWDSPDKTVVYIWASQLDFFESQQRVMDPSNIQFISSHCRNLKCTSENRKGEFSSPKGLSALQAEEIQFCHIFCISFRWLH